LGCPLHGNRVVAKGEKEEKCEGKKCKQRVLVVVGTEHGQKVVVVAGWRGWRRGREKYRFEPFRGFKSPISGHLLRMKREKKKPFVRNPVDPVTGRGVLSKTSHSFTWKQ